MQPERTYDELVTLKHAGHANKAIIWEELNK